MDPVRFDTLARSFSSSGTRRNLLRLLLAVPLAGSLAGLLGAQEAGAERPLDRVRDRAARKQQKRHNPGQHKDNPTRKRGGKGGKGGKRGKGGNSPLPFGAECASNGACESGICACRAHDCSGGGFCADASTGGCTAASVVTPSGIVGACTVDGGSFCPSGTCADPSQVCAAALFCAVLIPA
jgi:hypothetical protein